MNLREINDAFNQIKADVRDLAAESEHRNEMLDDVVKSCIQACPEQSSWKCESPAVFVRHLLSMRDAEIAKLRAACESVHDELTAKNAELARMESDLDAARNAYSEATRLIHRVAMAEDWTVAKTARDACRDFIRAAEAKTGIPAP